MTKKLLIAAVVLVVIMVVLVISPVPQHSAEPQETDKLPSIPTNPGIFCSSPGETDPSNCVDTRP